MRLHRFVGTQESCGCSATPHEVDDAKTSMSEIVKRFFNNEPIPQYNQEEHYDYDEETITHNVVHLDENGQPLKDKQGNIIQEENLNMEILEMVPIHPNAEDVDPYGDNDALGKLYGDANEKLGAFQRVQAAAKAQAEADANNAKIQYAVENGYSKQEDSVKSE